MTRPAVGTGPRPVAERQESVDMLAYAASLARRVVPVDPDDLAAVLRSRVLKLLHERAEGEIRHLPPPQTGHARQPEVFDAEGVIRPAQAVRKLPLPVVTAAFLIDVYLFYLMFICFI